MGKMNNKVFENTMMKPVNFCMSIQKKKHKILNRDIILLFGLEDSHLSLQLRLGSKIVVRVNTLNIASKDEKVKSF